MPEPFPGPIVITGSNGGLGTTLVEVFLDAGIRNIACHYRSSSDQVGKILAAAGLAPEDHLFKAELSKEEDVRSMQEAVESRLGAPWGLINMAGGSTNAVSWKMTLTDFNGALQNNLISTFLTTKAFLPRMRERGGGRIINISSIVAHIGAPGASHYCAAKAGIEGFTKAVAQEVANKSITVNALALGYFDRGIIAEVPANLLDAIKGRIPLKRLGSAAEISSLIFYLLSPGAAFMTGQVIHLNGGHYS